MGFYLNEPKSGDKEDWLRANGRILLDEEINNWDFSNKEFMLFCLVFNPLFSAAAWIFEKKELKAFSDPWDPRRKIWFSVSREKIREDNMILLGLLARF
jgi:hypothetical protein